VLLAWVIWLVPCFVRISTRVPTLHSLWGRLDATWTPNLLLHSYPIWSKDRTESYSIHQQHHPHFSLSLTLSQTLSLSQVFFSKQHQPFLSLLASLYEFLSCCQTKQQYFSLLHANWSCRVQIEYLNNWQNGHGPPFHAFVTCPWVGVTKRENCCTSWIAPTPVVVPFFYLSFSEPMRHGENILILPTNW